MLSAMLALPSNHSDLLALDYRGQITPRLVRIAEEFMAARYGEPLSISDLVTVCGCPRRTLFEAFRRYRDYTPMQFLTRKRMQKARGLLLSGPSRTVASVAQDCGFTHLGRFSVTYRERFGETSSETIAKHRSVAEPDAKP